MYCSPLHPGEGSKPKGLGRFRVIYVRCRWGADRTPIGALERKLTADDLLPSYPNNTGFPSPGCRGTVHRTDPRTVICHPWTILNRWTLNLTAYAHAIGANYHWLAPIGANQWYQSMVGTRRLVPMPAGANFWMGRGKGWVIGVRESILLLTADCVCEGRAATNCWTLIGCLAWKDQGGNEKENAPNGNAPKIMILFYIFICE